jgi:hypothetical protein
LLQEIASRIRGIDHLALAELASIEWPQDEVLAGYFAELALAATAPDAQQLLAAWSASVTPFGSSQVVWNAIGDENSRIGSLKREVISSLFQSFRMIDVFTLLSSFLCY